MSADTTCPDCGAEMRPIWDETFIYCDACEVGYSTIPTVTEGMTVDLSDYEPEDCGCIVTKHGAVMVFEL